MIFWFALVVCHDTTVYVIIGGGMAWQWQTTTTQFCDTIKSKYPKCHLHCWRKQMETFMTRQKSNSQMDKAAANVTCQSPQRSCCACSHLYTMTTIGCHFWSGSHLSWAKTCHEWDIMGTAPPHNNNKQ